MTVGLDVNRQSSVEKRFALKTARPADALSEEFPV